MLCLVLLGWLGSGLSLAAYHRCKSGPLPVGMWFSAMLGGPVFLSIFGLIWLFDKEL